MTKTSGGHQHGGLGDYQLLIGLLGRHHGALVGRQQSKEGLPEILRLARRHEGKPLLDKEARRLRRAGHSENELAPFQVAMELLLGSSKPETAIRRFQHAEALIARVPETLDAAGMWRGMCRASEWGVLTHSHFDRHERARIRSIFRGLRVLGTRQEAFSADDIAERVVESLTAIAVAYERLLDVLIPQDSPSSEVENESSRALRPALSADGRSFQPSRYRWITWVLEDIARQCDAAKPSSRYNQAEVIANAIEHRGHPEQFVGTVEKNLQRLLAVDSLPSKGKNDRKPLSVNLLCHYLCPEPPEQSASATRVRLESSIAWLEVIDVIQHELTRAGVKPQKIVDAFSHIGHHRARTLKHFDDGMQ